MPCPWGTWRCLRLAPTRDNACSRSGRAGRTRGRRQLRHRRATSHRRSRRHPSHRQRHRYPCSWSPPRSRSLRSRQPPQGRRPPRRQIAHPHRRRPQGTRRGRIRCPRDRTPGSRCILRVLRMRSTLRGRIRRRRRRIAGHHTRHRACSRRARSCCRTDCTPGSRGMPPVPRTQSTFPVGTREWRPARTSRRIHRPPRGHPTKSRCYKPSPAPRNRRQVRVPSMPHVHVSHDLPGPWSYDAAVSSWVQTGAVEAFSANAERHVGLADSELAVEHAAEPIVIVLARVHEQVLAIEIESPDDRLSRIRPGVRCSCGGCVRSAQQRCRTGRRPSGRRCPPRPM